MESLPKTVISNQCGSKIFQTMNFVRLNSLSLKYHRFTPSGCTHIGIKKFEFVANCSLIIKIQQSFQVFCKFPQNFLLNYF